MALVGYSDSENSDAESIEITNVPEGGKKFERTASKKIKVNLSAVSARPETSTTEEPASKRQRTAGAFSGFNSLLPAPTRTAQSSIRKGVSLKTSAEAAFTREPLQHNIDHHPLESDSTPRVTDVADGDSSHVSQPTEVKIVGKATRFVPLSVANARRNKKPLAQLIDTDDNTTVGTKSSQSSHADRPTNQALSGKQELKPRSRQALFTVDHDETTMATAASRDYLPEFSTEALSSSTPAQVIEHTHIPPGSKSDLRSVAADLNLSASEKRRLFGRDAKRDDLRVAHFDMDAEYRANQEIAAKGDLIEHRAVKAIAPGKHNLQQLVNNVRGQTEAIEDKWAEGRRNRNEAGNRYGW